MHTDTPKPRHTDTASFAWHGWQLALPGEWNPLRIEGGWRAGYVLCADLHRPRLGLRWATVKEKRFDPAEWVKRAIRNEVGQLALRQTRPLPLGAADEAFDASMHYADPDPPGRDVWVAHSRASGRLVQLIYHAPRRDTVLAQRVVPTLRDSTTDEAMPWSIFDLSCVAPAGMMLKSHQLNAGDLRLTFAARDGRLASVRQIAVARLALSRMPLEKWLRAEARTRAMHYRAPGDAEDVAVDTHDGRRLSGLCRALKRRRRCFFMRWLPHELHAAALHDEARDRLVLVQASDRELMSAMVATVGCGREGSSRGTGL